MLRSFLIFLSTAAWAQSLVTKWGIARRAAARFVAGSTLDDAIRVAKALNAKGINVTLDWLGEHTTSTAEANTAADQIIAMLDAIRESGVRSNISIKLSQIGMGLDDETCRGNLLRILERARKLKDFVRIDMEAATWTEPTIEFLTAVQQEGLGAETVGTVLQSYLYRTEADARKLVESGTRIRVVKGAYREPPEVAYPQKADVDASFDTIASILIDASLAKKTVLSKSGRIPPIPAIASHDEKRITFAKAYAEKIGLPKRGIEFQMLYGIRRDLQEALAAEGYPVRVYVPFGTHWYPYFMRRLAERPANIWFFLSNAFRR